MSDGWYGPAIDNHCRSTIPAHGAVVDKGVLHMTVSPPGSFKPQYDNYFGHQSYPHFTTDVQGGVFKVWQHISLRKAAKALRNASGGVATNTDGVIQIEVVGNPGTTDRLHSDPKLHEVHMEGLRLLMRWIEEQTDIPRTSTVDGFHQYPPENGHRLGSEPWRMTFDEWRGYRGWCAHQHVPENYHGDALFDIKGLLGLSAPTPLPQPIVKKEIRMFIVDDPTSTAQWICDAHTKRRSNSWDECLGLEMMGTPWLKEVPETVARRNALLQQRTVVASV